MKKTLFLSLILSGAVALAQPNTSKADAYYNKYSYSKVIENLEGKKNLPTKAERQLAESYKMLANFNKSEEHYAQLVTHEDKTPSDVFAYAQILKMNGKYKESSEQMEVYASLNSNDKRLDALNRDKNYVQTLLLDKGQFKIKDLDLNSMEQDFGPAYFKNQLVYTTSHSEITAAKRKWNGNNLSFLDIYVADIDSNNAELKHSKRYNSLNRKYHEGPVTYNKDGSQVFFTRNNYSANSTDGVTKLELYESTFKDGKWSEQIPFLYNNKEYSVGHPALSRDGTTLYFASDMPGGLGGTDLYKCERQSDGSWTKPVNLGDKVNTEGNEMFPFSHQNDMLFFSSDGHAGLGGLDVFVTPMNENIGVKVVNLGMPINSSKDDFSYIMNDTETKGYFASNREGGKGSDDIYSIDVMKPFVFGKRIQGVVMDKTGALLAGSTVKLYDDKGVLLFSSLTKEDGSFKFDIEENSKDFIVSSTKPDFLGDKKAVFANQTELPVTLILEKNIGFSIYGLITDNKTKLAIEGVSVKLTDLQGRELDFVTPVNGDFRAVLDDMQLGDDLIYKIEIKKEGFLSKTLSFEKLLDKPGEIKLHEALDISLGKIELGADIGSLININPIYFDLNKFVIRKDAASELDKIVKAMNENAGMIIELGSHTDCRSSIAYNLSLSDKRAKASAAYVVSKGISKERIYGKGYGESKLKNTCACEGAVKSTCSEDEHQQNRRTEFIIIKLKD